MRVPSSKREILNALFHADNWLDLYELHEKYQLTPGIIVQTISFLQEHGLLEIDGMNAKLSEAGRAWVFLNRKSIFYGVDRDWVRPAQNADARVAARSPYMPRKRSLNTKFFRDLD